MGTVFIVSEDREQGLEHMWPCNLLLKSASSADERWSCYCPFFFIKKMLVPLGIMQGKTFSAGELINHPGFLQVMDSLAALNEHAPSTGWHSPLLPWLPQLPPGQLQYQKCLSWTC